MRDCSRSDEVEQPLVGGLRGYATVKPINQNGDTVGGCEILHQFIGGEFETMGIANLSWNENDDALMWVKQWMS